MVKRSRVGAGVRRSPLRRAISPSAAARRQRKFGIGRRAVPTRQVTTTTRELTQQEQEAARDTFRQQELAKLEQEAAETLAEINRIEGSPERQERGSELDFLSSKFQTLSIAIGRVRAGETIAFQDALSAAEAAGVAKQERTESGETLRQAFQEGRISEAEFERRFTERTGTKPLITRRETINPQIIERELEKDILPESFLKDETREQETIPELINIVPKNIETGTDIKSTIAGEPITIKEEPISTLEVFKPEEQKVDFGFTLGEGIKFAIGDIGFNIQNLLTGSKEEFKNPGDILAASGIKKGEQIVGVNLAPSNILLKGTKIDEGFIPLEFQSTEGLTFRELSERRAVLNLPQIDTDLEKRQGQVLFETTKLAGETGTLVALSFAGPTGLALSSSFVASKGFFTAEQSQQQFKQAQRLESIGEFELAKEARASGFKQLGIGGLQLGLGLFGTGASLRGIEAQVDKAALEQLQSKPIKVKGVAIEGKEGSQVFIIKGTRDIGKTARQDITIKLPAFQQKALAITGRTETGIEIPLQKLSSEGFRVTGAEVKVDTKLFSFGQEKFLFDSRLFGLQARGTGTTGDISFISGPSKVTLKDTELVSSRGTGILFEKTQPKIEFKFKTKATGLVKTNLGDVKSLRINIQTPTKGQLTEFKFGGIVGQKDDIISFISGPAQKARLQLDTGKSTLLFDPKVGGKIQILRQQGIDKIKTVSSTGPTQQSLVQQQKAALASISVPTQIVGEKSAQQLALQIKSPALKTIGTGVSSSTLLKPQETKLQTIQSPSLKLETRQSLSTLQTPSTLQRERTQQRTRVETKAIQQQNLSSVQLQSLSSATVQSQKLQTQQALQTGFGIPVIVPSIKFPPTTTRLPFLFFPKGKGKPKQPRQQRVRVQVREQGRFKTIGTRETAREAFSLGAGRVGTTLAATFRLQGKGLFSGFALPKEFRRKKGKRLTFVEVPSARLDTPSEVKQIQIAKSLKGGKLI